LESSTGAGVYGHPNQNVKDLLDNLNGKLGENEMAPGFISGIETDISHGLASQIIGDLAGDGVGDFTWFAGDSDGHWIGTISTTSMLSDAHYLQAQKTDALGVQLGKAKVAIEQVQEATADEFAAQAQTMDTLAVQLGDTKAAVQSEQRARVSGDAANAQQINTLATSVGDINAAVQTKASVSSVDTLAANVVGDLAGDDVGDYIWFAGDNDGRWVGTVTPTSMLTDAKFLQELAAANLHTTLAASIDGVDAAVQTKADASALETVEGQQQALANTVTTLAARVGNVNAAIQEKASVSALTTLDGKHEALANTVTTLATSVGDANAAIQAEQSARATGDAANAQQISTLAVQLGDTNAAVQTSATALSTLEGKLAAEWGVTTQVHDGNRVIMTGMSMGASVGANGQSQSQILMMADTIAFLNKPDGQLHTPFVFDVANDTAIINYPAASYGVLEQRKLIV